MAKWYPCQNCGKNQPMHNIRCPQCKEVYVPRMPGGPRKSTAALSAVLLGSVSVVGVGAVLLANAHNRWDSRNAFWFIGLGVAGLVYVAKSFKK